LGTPAVPRYWSARLLQRHGPRAARAVLLCAGAYVLGALYSNECPAGSVRITTEAACRTAVAAAGKRIDSSFVVTDSGYPRGCFSTRCDNLDPSCNYAYFNAHPLGAVPTSDGSRLLCAAVATGAPPRACARVDARVYAGVSRTEGGVV
jgi:hypothetical protein